MGWNHWFGHGAASRRRVASLAAGLAIAVVGGMTSMTASAQLTGIAATKHNLGSTGTGVNKFSGTAEICVFCHTPHGADTTAAVPLWNRTLTGTTYTTYDSLGTSSTLDGKTAAVGSVSIACLSCHDGTQAMNTVINAPGSGATGDAAWNNIANWTGANQTAGKITSIANLGTDLKNDHPVGIQYGGGGYKVGALTGNGLTTSGTTDPDFKPAANALIGSTRVWWVDTGTASNGRQKTDMMLYTRAATAGYTGQTVDEPFVECASCHDPHTNDNPTFLRISNAGSAVCLACHVK